MENIRLNTSLFPIADVAMYGTILDSNYIEEWLNENEENRIEVNQDEYEKSVVLSASNFIKSSVVEPFKKYGIVSIENFSLHHPHDYNYGTDLLFFDVILSENFNDIMKKYLSEFSENEKFRHYVEDNFVSRPGFYSYMPESIDEILHPQKTSTKREHEVGAFLSLCIENEPQVWLDIKNSDVIIWETLVEDPFKFADYAKQSV